MTEPTVRAIERQFAQEAEATAAQHNYDVSAIQFQLTRYQFGSLANNWEAGDMRRRLRGALSIAIARLEPPKTKDAMMKLHDQTMGMLAAE